MQYVSSTVGIPWTDLSLIFAGMFGLFVRTRLAFIPRRHWMVAICTSSSVWCRLLDIRYNSPTSFHSFHSSERLRLSTCICNSEEGLMHSMSLSCKALSLNVMSKRDRYTSKLSKSLFQSECT